MTTMQEPAQTFAPLVKRQTFADQAWCEKYNRPARIVLYVMSPLWYLGIRNPWLVPWLVVAVGLIAAGSAVYLSL